MPFPCWLPQVAWLQPCLPQTDCLLTIGNALAHDVYFDGDGNKAQAMRRVMLSKFALLVVALIAAYVAAQRPAGILYLVSASFSLAGAAFVPVDGPWHLLEGCTHALARWRAC